MGFHPWVGKIPWRRKWQPTPVFLPGKLQGQKSLVGYSQWVAKSQTQLRDLATTLLSKLLLLSRVQLFCDPWTVAHQAPLSMRFPRQEYWSGLPIPSPGDLLNPGTEPISPALAGRCFTTKLSVQFSSVAQSCPTLCNPMNRSTPGLPVHHQLPEFIQTHIHRVSDAIQPSHPRSSPSSPTPNPSQRQSLFQ